MALVGNVAFHPKWKRATFSIYFSGARAPRQVCYTAGARAGSMLPATRLRPPFLATYSAASAASIQARRLLWRWSAGATPMLLVMRSSGRVHSREPSVC